MISSVRPILAVGAAFRRVLPTLCLVLLLMTLAACSDDDDDNSSGSGGSDSATSQQDEFCTDLDELQDNLKGIATAVGTLNRDRIEDAIKEVQEDVDDVRSSGQAIRSDNSGDISTAFDDLKSAVQSVGQGGGLSTNLREIQSSLTSLVNATSAAISEYDCRS